MKTNFYLIIIPFFFFSINSLWAQSEEVYKVVEEMPIYGECSTLADVSEKKICSDKAIYEFLAQEIVYPDSAFTHGVEGTVVVKFIVDKNGDVKNPTVVKDIGDGCGEEAIRVVELMKGWIPGKQGGENVDVQLHLPVKFKIRLIPVTYRSEKFQYLSDLFCANYLTDFVKIDRLHAMADSDLSVDNVCNVSDLTNGITHLKITLKKKDGTSKSVESADGTFSGVMRSMFKESNIDDVLEFEYKLRIHAEGQEEFTKDVYKSVIVE